MKKTIFSLSIIILLSFQALSAQLSTQEKDPLYFIGGYGAYSYNMHFAEFRALPNVPCCGDNFEDGSGSGWAAGLLFEIPLRKTVLLGFRAGIISHNGTLEKSEMIGNSLNTETFETIGGGNPAVDVYSKNTIDSRLMSIGIDPYVSFKFFDQINSYIGFRLGYFINGSFDQIEKITRPNNVTFKGGSLTRNERNNEEIPEFNPLQIWGMFGLGYDLPIGRKTYLTPEIRYYLPFMDLTDVYWKTASLQFGLSLRYPIMADDRVYVKDTIFNRDTTVVPLAGISNEKIVLMDVKRETIELQDGNLVTQRTLIKERYRREIPDKKLLTASLIAEAIAADGSRKKNPMVIIEEIETVEQFPLLPQVFFQAGSSDLTKTGLRLLSKSDVGKFSETELPWKTLDLYEDLVNIIGLRLKQNPSARITITGANNATGVEAGNLELSEKRAVAVKNYLVDIWGIEPARIAIEKRGLPEMPSSQATTDGIEENSRSEISSTDFAIIKPVVLKDIRRKANPPVVEIIPEVNAEAGLESWIIDINQGSQRIRQFSGDDKLRTINWEIEEEPIPSTESAIAISLAAKDKIGQSAVANQNLVLEQLTIRKKRDEIKDDKIIEKYSLILFDFDKAEIKPNHIRTLNEIKQQIKPNSKVTISGYADRIGDRDYNRELSRRRIENTQKILQVPSANLTTKPIGNDVLLYDNSSPQGRAYSRTVQILIETPVK